MQNITTNFRVSSKHRLFLSRNINRMNLITRLSLFNIAALCLETNSIVAV